LLIVERVDFVSVPTRDVARARTLYGELLGLHRRYASPRPDGMSHAASREPAAGEAVR